MRIDSVSGYGYANSIGPSKVSSSKNNSNVNVTHPKFVRISFTGAPLNMKQLISPTPENNGLGLAETKQGGQGVVAHELIASLRKHEGIDARSSIPFFSYNNNEGGYKFLLHPKSEFPKGVEGLPDEIPNKWFYSAKKGETLEQVANKFHLAPSEISYAIQSRPNGEGAEAKSRYCILEPTTSKGEVLRLSDEVFGEIKTVRYEFFIVSEHNPSYNTLKEDAKVGNPHFVCWTPELARTSKPYSYDSWGNGSFDAELLNSDEMRSLDDALQKDKFNTKEFGYFRPAHAIVHDRPMQTFPNHVANSSARGVSNLDGMIVDIIDHNTGFNYQGRTGDPFKFLAIVADETDLEKLKKNHHFEILKKAHKYGINNTEMLTPKEREIAWAILEPALRPFRDAFGAYNILKVGIAAVSANPSSVSLGTVSGTFDKEMKSQDTPDAAKGLTDDFANIPTKSVLNGSTPANLKLDDPTAQFGRGNNGLSANRESFTTFKYDGNNIEEVVKAREKNAKWFTNLVYEAYQKGQDALKELFFNKAQISDGQKVMGYLKPVNDGDIVVMGWGRPDEQKGFNISLDGFKKFLQNDKIPQAQKMKFRLCLGAGKWDENAKDYKSIVRLMKEIEELDGGIYKGLVMYVDGFFPNRLVGCAQYGLFTSRREMCGITPLECKAAGVPYGTTGSGPADYTNESNGFLTKTVEGRPEKYGLTWNNTPDEIDDARCSAAADEISEVFEKMADEHTNHRDVYIAKCKKNIEEKIDWHNNMEYNGGKSANRRYLDDIFRVDKGWEARNKDQKKRLMGSFGEYVDRAEEVLNRSAKSGPMKVIFCLIGVAAVGTGAYWLYKNKQKKPLDKVA